mmetsp:Transcript_36673/g.71115  ORF Transcript_36673/g.71115 Transcript_36673/m.71115 type:complete len:110 (-) Transcript_36673:562-891(-)
MRKGSVEETSGRVQMTCSWSVILDHSEVFRLRTAGKMLPMRCADGSPATTIFTNSSSGKEQKMTAVDSRIQPQLERRLTASGGKAICPQYSTSVPLGSRLGAMSNSSWK